MIKCPADTTDWYAEFSDQGYEIESITGTGGCFSWAPNGGPAYEVRNCYSVYTIITPGGIFYMEPRFVNDVYSYNNNPDKLWHTAKTGYYLSPFYRKTSGGTWYHGVKPCTNAPQHAHYTGAGTPDAPDGSVIDANDCPWECDDGYGLHGDVCVPLCASGIQYIRTGNGLRFNLYPVAYSSPTLAVRNNGIICYGVLGAGSSKNAININVSGKTYHTEN